MESVSLGRPGRNHFEVHQVCRDLAFTHHEGVVNLDKVDGKGRIMFMGPPLRIRGGPVRAVTPLEE